MAPQEATAWHTTTMETVTDCNLEVVNFCLIDMEMTEQDSRDFMSFYDFLFTIEVRASEGCGNLETELDIVRDSDNMYLGAMQIDHTAVVSSIDCECAQEFQVNAGLNTTHDYRGAYYGQLEITNFDSSFIIVTDSCLFDF